MLAEPQITKNEKGEQTGTDYDVSKPPISMDLLVLESRTAADVDMDVTWLKPFHVRHLGRQETYTLVVKIDEERRRWCSNIIEAKTSLANSLYAQKAEPLGIRIIANSGINFVDLVSDDMLVKGTPLRHALLNQTVQDTDESKTFSDLIISVNCSTVFKKPDSDNIILLIGADDGIYAGDYDSPVRWKQVSLNWLWPYASSSPSSIGH